jgi:hypothetical protein
MDETSSAEIRAPRVERYILAAAILVGVVHRLVFGWSAPLWLDETYTAVIASEPDVHGLFLWCRNELSGPVYYAGMWLWEKLVGDGNFALRLPSLIASLGAIALIAVAGGPNQRERRLWAGLTAVWLPGLLFVAQARPQALLFLLATVQAIAFLRCIDRRSPRWLTIWSAVSALMILTHLHATAIIGLQALCILWTFRPRLREVWPSIAIFAIVALWLPLQLSFVAGILKPGAALYPVLGLKDLLKIPYYLFAANVAAFAVVALVVGILVAQWTRRRSAGEPMPYSRTEAMLALSGLLSVTVVVAAGFVRSSFEPRYLLPYMPSLLFGLTLVLARTRLLSGALPGFILAMWAGAAVDNIATFLRAEAQQRLNSLEYERGSEWLMRGHARRVIFVWDNPTSALSGPVRQAEIASFFFRRAHYPVELQAIYLGRDARDPARLAALADARDAGILWVGGVDYPAGLHAMPRFDCRDFGGGTSRSLVCIRKERPARDSTSPARTR